MISVKAHFDGEHIRLDEPVVLKPQARLIVTVLDEAATTDSPQDVKPLAQAIERPGWVDLALTLARQLEKEGVELPSDLAEHHDYYAHGKPKP